MGFKIFFKSFNEASEKSTKIMSCNIKPLRDVVSKR